ncbi:hypothetical protein LPH60_00020 [Xylella taiwanensis]|nr:hypothetical protein [Xylella taiwanensis]MCD8468828.1 hypothetical protein [Xylella taiwanensis]
MAIAVVQGGAVDLQVGGVQAGGRGGGVTGAGARVRGRRGRSVVQGGGGDRQGPGGADQAVVVVQAVV